MQNRRYFKEVPNLEFLKKAYREWALKLHPDRGGNEEAFKEMLNEYQRLEMELSNSFLEPKWSKEVEDFAKQWRSVIWRDTYNGNLKAKVGNADLLIFKKNGTWKGLITIDETENIWLWGKFSWDYETKYEVKQAIYRKINDLIVEKYAG